MFQKYNIGNKLDASKYLFTWDVHSYKIGGKKNYLIYKRKICSQIKQTVQLKDFDAPGDDIDSKENSNSNSNNQTLAWLIHCNNLWISCRQIHLELKLLPVIKQASKPDALFHRRYMVVKTTLGSMFQVPLRMIWDLNKKQSSPATG